MALKVNGRTFWAGEERVPLPGGKVGIGTWGKVTFDDVVVSGTIAQAWLRERGLLD